MPREVRVSDDDGSSVVTMLIERGWLAFIILGIFIVGLRLFNVSQRAQQRKLLREGLMAEMGYYNKGMSFFSVSGLDVGGADALQVASTATSTASRKCPISTPNTSLLEAIRNAEKSHTEPEEMDALFDEAFQSKIAADEQRNVSSAPIPHPVSVISPPPPRKAKAKKASAVERVSYREGAGPIPTVSPAVKAAALRQSMSSFRAENPSDVECTSLTPELVHTKLKRALLEHMKIESFTRIQQLCWKAMLDRGRDVLVRSETGSGKTLAYGLPIIHDLLCDCDVTPIHRDIGTLVIIMCPTRELVLQVTDTFTALTRFAQFLTIGGIHGGENRHKEKARLRKGIPVLVTTPGRLLDHLKQTASFIVENARTVVMDEADRLLDMGFERAIREIMDLLAEKCISPNDLKRILVSATITDGVERLSHFALRSNVARIGETQDTFSIPSTLKQHFVSVPTKHRLSTLLSFLRSQTDAGASKIVVFVSTSDSAEFLYYLTSRLASPFQRRALGGFREVRKAPARSTKKMVELANQHLHSDDHEVVTFDADSEEDEAEAKEDGERLSSRENALLDVNVFKLHGNMKQVDRASVFHAFKYGTNGNVSAKGVLFCTDVAARGLDMPKVDWIVHFDPPMDPASYIHRIGRTARIGHAGDSILFLMPHQVGYASYLTNFIGSHPEDTGRAADSTTMLEKKYETYLFYLTKLDPKSNHMWLQSTATLERAISGLVMRKDYHAADAQDNLSRIALFAYQSYIRAYAGAPKMVKDTFFPSSELHLGHVAHSFGIDKSPAEVQRQLQSFVREDRALVRDNRRGTLQQDRDAPKQKKQRIELEHDERYRSALAQKQRKVTRDWAEKRRETSNKIKPLQFSEFDA